METQAYNQSTQSTESITLKEAVFNTPLNQDLLYQVVTSQMANQRQNIAHTKDRAQVSGGGKKPWKQKGTGRSRHGSIRSPIWKGGGVTFGPTKDKIYTKKINKKMARKALAVALSEKARSGQLLVVETINLEQPKTKFANIISKSFLSAIKGAKTANSLLIAVGKMNDNVRRAFSNLPNTKIVEARNLSALSVLSHKYLAIAKDALSQLEENKI